MLDCCVHAGWALVALCPWVAMSCRRVSGSFSSAQPPTLLHQGFKERHQHTRPSRVTDRKGPHTIKGKCGKDECCHFSIPNKFLQRFQNAMVPPTPCYDNAKALCQMLNDARMLYFGYCLTSVYHLTVGIRPSDPTPWKVKKRKKPRESPEQQLQRLNCCCREGKNEKR